MGIYEIGALSAAWDTRVMVKAEKKQEAEAFAREIARRLDAVRPPHWNEKNWTEIAGVSPSFFSNLRGTKSKPPSVPSVKLLADLLAAADVTLAEFFLPDALGRVVRMPNEQDAERRLTAALVQLPRKPADRVPYLLRTLRGVLGLPAGLPATQNVAAMKEAADPEEGALPRSATS